MRVPGQRKSVRDGEILTFKGPYSTYENKGKSLEDLFLYFDEFNFPTELEDSDKYAAELKLNGYYGDTFANYARNLKFWMK